MSILRARLDDLIWRWKVSVHETTETESSFLVFGERSGQPVVLKVIKHEGEEWRSGHVLEAFQGRGIVRVYEYVDGAVLLERAMPGQSLVRMTIDGKDEEATAILADVIGQMFGCTPPMECQSVRDWTAGFERYLAAGKDHIPGDLVEDGHTQYVALATSQRHVGLLHGDLHHYNVLSDARRGWLAIDPKGVVGEIDYEIGAVLRNPFEMPELFTSPNAIERRLEHFARRLNLSAERTLRWAFAQAVLSMVLAIEDGLTVTTESSYVKLAKTLRRMIAAGG